jgi:heme-degrading monooxygenase HmoA
MRVKPGMEERLREMGRAAQTIPGFVFEHVYRLDATPNEYLLVVGFASKEAYVTNANSPEQHQRYQEYRALLDADPEWNDGEIVDSFPPLA